MASVLDMEPEGGQVQDNHAASFNPELCGLLAVSEVTPASNNSFDAEDELDKDLAEELSRFRTPDTWNNVAQHLDLVWKVGRSRGKRSVCSCCQGSGEEECAWCHGTGALGGVLLRALCPPYSGSSNSSSDAKGAMMVGDTLFRSADGRSHCPICKGKRGRGGG
ncbi:hypothetical protein COO60DRAFT_1638441 [Scenedesmus sp. NREL 46B-D3]|nr:hypothetical protein COO60DRAFT_1638441 [Scenedesmus sp. NREL 46B-D3]